MFSLCAYWLSVHARVFQAKAQLGSATPEPEDSPSGSPAHSQTECSAPAVSEAASGVAQTSLEVKEAAQKVVKKPKKKNHKKHSAPVSYLVESEVSLSCFSSTSSAAPLKPSCFVFFQII